jgi:hypothetical protein
MEGIAMAGIEVFDATGEPLDQSFQAIDQLVSSRAVAAGGPEATVVKRLVVGYHEIACEHGGFREQHDVITGVPRCVEYLEAPVAQVERVAISEFVGPARV